MIENRSSATEWQHIGNQIDTAMIFARSHFVNVCRNGWLHRLIKSWRHRYLLFNLVLPCYVTAYLTKRYTDSVFLAQNGDRATLLCDHRWGSTQYRKYRPNLFPMMC